MHSVRKRLIELDGEEHLDLLVRPKREVTQDCSFICLGAKEVINDISHLA